MSSDKSKNFMNKTFTFVLAFSVIGVVFTSCNTEEETPTPLSQWQLIELLADPGDGSGTFQPVTSNKIIGFYDDSTLICNGNLCQLGGESTPTTSGTYSLTDSTISPTGCPVSIFPLTFEMEGDNLILNYPCIEACREKYVQID